MNFPFPNPVSSALRGLIQLIAEVVVADFVSEKTSEDIDVEKDHEKTLFVGRRK